MYAYMLTNDGEHARSCIDVVIVGMLEPGALCCVSLPLSLSPCFLSFLELFFELKKAL